ncbi:MAG TPA: hypothetical protein VM691_03480, partial [Myxococcales bacterium]|nr:hypothetical protein [Myxococcales bacterium]
GMASAVCQGFPLEVQNPLREVVWPLIDHGFAAPNPLQAIGVPGLWSAAPYFAALAAAIGFLVWRRAAALGIALAVALAQWTAPARTDLGAARFLAAQWRPSPPPGAKPF